MPLKALQLHLEYFGHKRVQILQCSDMIFFGNNGYHAGNEDIECYFGCIQTAFSYDKKGCHNYTCLSLSLIYLVLRGASRNASRGIDYKRF